MRPALVRREDYCQYLLATFANYTGSYLADQLGCCHDAVSDFLGRDRLTPRLLWDRVSEHLPSEQRLGGVLVLDDSVLDKRYARRIELARRQWSGNAKQVLNGIGLVNLLYVLPSDPTESESEEPQAPVYLPVDYRLFDPDHDGFTKHDHARQMLEGALHGRGFGPAWVTMDTWYAALKLLKWLDRQQQRFAVPVRCDRQVSLRQGEYQRVDSLSWTPQQLQQGQEIWLRGLGRVRCFRLVVRKGDTEEVDFIVTNDLEVLDIEVIRGVMQARWRIEQYHRELKQVSGIELCQARKGRSQRNHIWCAIRVWLALWQRAQQAGQSVYAVKQGLLDAYLRHQLQHPTIPIGLA